MIAGVLGVNSEGKIRNVAIVVFNKVLLCCVNDVYVVYLQILTKKGVHILIY